MNHTAQLINNLCFRFIQLFKEYNIRLRASVGRELGTIAGHFLTHIIYIQDTIVVIVWVAIVFDTYTVK